MEECHGASLPPRPRLGEEMGRRGIRFTCPRIGGSTSRRLSEPPSRDIDRFARDSPLEQGGFELPVPPKTPGVLAVALSRARRLSLAEEPLPDLLDEALPRAELGRVRAVEGPIQKEHAEGRTRSACARRPPRARADPTTACAACRTSDAGSGKRFVLLALAYTALGRRVTEGSLSHPQRSRVRITSQSRSRRVRQAGALILGSGSCFNSCGRQLAAAFCCGGRRC
jgi:hypothetical protein